MRVALIGGGTAGHLAPCIAIAEAIQAADAEAKLLLIGANRELDRKLLATASLPCVFIDAKPFPYRPGFPLVAALIALARARRQALRHLRAFRPDVAISTGGYVTAAAVPAAHRLGAAIVLHVPDAYPDRASRMLARQAAVISLGYERARGSFPKGQTVYTGVPIRKAVVRPTRCEALGRMGLSGQKRTLLVTGGSQGARRLNSALVEALPALLARNDLQIVHLTGTANFGQVKAATASYGGQTAYHPLPYLEEMGFALAAADLALSRAGASSVAEIMARGVPAILVPYPHAGGHQRLNAVPLAEAGGAVIVDDADLDAERLLGLLTPLLDDPQRRAEMASRCAAMARPKAASGIAQIAMQCASATLRNAE